MHIVLSFKFQRFNVAVTRAKALLIVVGNPEVLILDPHWRALIKFIIDNGGYTGEPSLEDLEKLIRAAEEPAEESSVPTDHQAAGSAGKQLVHCATVGPESLAAS